MVVRRSEMGVQAARWLDHLRSSRSFKTEYGRLKAEWARDKSPHSRPRLIGRTRDRYLPRTTVGSCLAGESEGTT